MGNNPQHVVATCGLIVALLFLSGCATQTLSKSECATADWRVIGYGDGAAGHGAERIDGHRRACARFGVTPDLMAYNQGRSEGLREYCTAPKGLELGRANGDCGICNNFPNVVAACRHGKRIYATDQAIATVEESLARANRAIANARAWTPAQALSQQLARIDRDISWRQREIDSAISRNQSRIEKIREESGPESEINEINRNIASLRRQRNELDVTRERRRGNVRVAHERDRETLIIENQHKLSENLETKTVNETRRSELYAERAALLEDALLSQEGHKTEEALLDQGN